MKITKKDIDLISEAIVNEVYDDTKINELIRQDEEKMWNDFAKSKKRKDTLKLLDACKKIEWFNGISVASNKFFDTKNWCWNYTIFSEKTTKESYMTNAYYIARKKYPDRYIILNKVKTLLTIKMLWGKDIETVMNEIKDALKKEYKGL